MAAIIELGTPDLYGTTLHLVSPVRVLNENTNYNQLI